MINPRVKLDLQVTTIVCCNLAFLFFQVVWVQRLELGMQRKIYVVS